MPIYEYRCGACGHYLDALQKVSDPPLVDCPDCSAASLKRLISAPSFRLKGSGWYETDFKSDKERRRNLADGSGRERGEKSGAADAGPDSAKSKKTEDAGKKAGTKSGDTGGKSSSSGSKGSGSEAA